MYLFSSDLHPITTEPFASRSSMLLNSTISQELKAELALKIIPKAEKSEYTLNILVVERDLMEKFSDSPRFVNLRNSRHDSIDESCRLSFHCVIKLYLGMNSKHLYGRPPSHNFCAARYNRDIGRGSRSEVHDTFTVP